ncbi:DUF397 domain-containing protein [Uniformispora flossi]|uniref:DUF397 domain-containing protein n=1 Tax=Uniformispora flossi TaxID=3390723 RepID=UPI003C2B0CD5
MLDEGAAVVREEGLGAVAEAGAGAGGEEKTPDGGVLHGSSTLQTARPGAHLPDSSAQPRPLGWRKSSYSGQTAQECVEVAPLGGAVGTRDSKDVCLGHLAIPASSWSVLTAAIKR